MTVDHHGTHGSHIAFFTVPSHGHVYPVLDIVAELVARGHRVSYATTAEFGAQVAAAGATPVLYRSIMPSPTNAAQKWPESIAGCMALYLDEAVATLAEIEAAFTDDLPDLAVVDDVAGAGAVLARKRTVPAVQVWPFLAANGHWSLPLHGGRAHAPSPADMFRYGNAFTSFLRTSGLRMSLPEYFAGQSSGGIVLFPREFQFRGETFDDSFVFVGPCIGRRAFQGEWQPPGNGRPILLVSLGTSYNDRPDFYRMCAEALADMPWHVVMAVGQRIAAGQLGHLPDNIEAHAHVPQLGVLAHASAFVTHAGMGSIMESLLHAVPLIAIPQVFEQEVNAERVAQVGAGVVLPRDGLSAPALRDAIRRVSADSVLDSVRHLQQRIREAGGTGAAADEIESRLHGAAGADSLLSRSRSTPT